MSLHSTTTTGKPVGPAQKLTHRPIRSAVVAEVDADGCAELVHVGQNLAGPGTRQC